MNKKILAVVCVAILLVAGVAAVFILRDDDSSGIAITNTDGTTTVIPHVAEKIVVMNVNTAEAVIVLGMGAKVVGVSSTTYSRSAYMNNFPNCSTSVGSSTEPSLDVIADCDPDVVIGFSTLKIKNQAQLEELGYPVLYLDCYNTANGQLQKDMTNLGKALGAETAATTYITYLNDKIDSIMDIANSVSSTVRSNMRVYAEFSSTTYTNGYPAQCKSTSTDVVLSALGVVNVSGEQAYGSYVSAEFIAASNADYVIKIYDLSKSNAGSVLAEVADRACISSLEAKEDNQIYELWNEISYGPRIFASYLAFCQIFFPTETTASGLTIQGLLENYNATFGASFVTTYGIVQATP
ncbi:MAG: ABC transporter substrate-binding protein [Candidatus Methanomethylophilaceae archaeon]